MKKFSGGVLFSALSLLLLLSFFLLLFLEDYKIKGEFQIKLANYYLALSLKEWVEEKYLSGSEQVFFPFSEGTVAINYPRNMPDIVEYIVVIKEQTFKIHESRKTEETIESQIESSSYTVESTIETIENIPEVPENSTEYSDSINSSF